MPRSRPQRRSPHARRPRPADPSPASGGTKGYSTREVAEALDLPTSRILSWTRRGLLSPRRAPGGAYLFSFQDLVLLRTVRELAEADVPTRRIRESIDALREQLPIGRPLSAVSISAVGARVLVQDEDAVWEPGSGQLQLTLEDVPPSEGPSSIDVGARTAGLDAIDSGSADDLYDAALDLEAHDPTGAIAAYREVIEIEPAHAEAHLNLGRLLHERGQLDEAERQYRLASDADPASGRALFNLGVVQEDLGSPDLAITSYEAAVGHEHGLAVAHFNLSRLYEADGRKADALQHLSAYKQLVERGSLDG